MTTNQCPPCNGNCNQGRACPAHVSDREERGVRGGGIVRAIGWVAFAWAFANVAAQAWRAMA